MAEALTAARRRRGTIRASITKFEARILKWEAKEELTGSDHRAIQRGVEALKEYDAEFKTSHYAVVELANEEELDAEQVILDNHTDRVTEFSDRLLQLLPEPERESKSSAASTVAESLLKRLRYVIYELTSLNDSADLMEPGPGMDTCLLRQLRRQVNNLDSELADITHKILSLDSGEEALMEERSKVKKVLLKVDLKVDRLLLDVESSPKVGKAEAPGIRLPKISVPSFDGNILNWTSFWEQFEVAVHSKDILRDVEKLAYLRDAVKNSPAKNVIEGLSRTAGSYAEAVECLRERYDRPRLIHQAHVRAILEAPSMKSGSGQELRHLHDVVKQHMRALEAMKSDSLKTFVSSLIELKLDRSSMFAWQNHSKDQKEVPSYTELLEFIDLRARASENITREGDPKRDTSKRHHVKSYVTDVQDSCAACRANHQLHKCKDFCAMSHDRKMAIIKGNGLCMNCLQQGHFLKNCPSPQRCKKCHQPHHSLLHIDSKSENRKAAKASPRSGESTDVVTANVSRIAQHKQVLLMTCKVQILGPDGSKTQARALLDSASSTSFITERLTQRLGLKRKRVDINISGIGGNLFPLSPKGAVDFRVTSLKSGGRRFPVQAIVLRKVTSDLPSSPTPFNDKWKHLSGLELADPDFGTPGAIDLLLGTEIFGQIVLHGRRFGPRGSPTALRTHFGWVLGGSVNGERQQDSETCFLTTTSAEDLLRRFWEVEDPALQQPVLSVEEKTVVRHFEETHTRDEVGRFVVPLPIKEDAEPLGETRTLAVRRFRSLERSLRSSGKFDAFAEVMNEYFNQTHAERVPPQDMPKPCHEVFYLPMHAVHKTTSTTTKLRVVFDASARSSTGVSLNDQLLVGPTVHAPLIDVLLRFRQHKVALTTDISKMYRAVLLPEAQRDLHRFVWRRHEHGQLEDYRMTRLTFGVSASSFAANMAVKTNAMQNKETYPRAALAVEKSFYVDDGLTGADSVSEAIVLQKELQQLFDKGGFLLRKWISNEPEALRHLPENLVEQATTRELPVSGEFTKVLGINWDTESDSLHLTTSIVSSERLLTKRMLASNVARVYDVLGWYSPAIIKIKILLQQLWVAKIGWDDLVPSAVQSAWDKWKNELPVLGQRFLPRCYYPTGVNTSSRELHGFCDASELAYGGVVYLRFKDPDDNVRVALVIAKTKVAPIKNLSMPRLELCGAVIVSRLLDYCRKVLEIPINNTYAWTDSTVVLSWVRGNPRRFKPFVGNRVSGIMDQIPPDRWRHVPSTTNPADCVSRGLYPQELTAYELWWNGPSWLLQSPSDWPATPTLTDRPEPSEEKMSSEGLVLVSLAVITDLPLLERISNYKRLRRVTAWMRRFVDNCRARVKGEEPRKGNLSAKDLVAAEKVWIAAVQQTTYSDEVTSLKKGEEITKGRLLQLHPFLDEDGLLRVGGRTQQAIEPYDKRHPFIIPSKHRFTKMLIEHEHARLMHAGPTLVAASLARRFVIVGARQAVRDVTRSCVTCRRVAGKPRPQLLGRLPADRLRPGPVFDKVGVDYAGPILVKSGYVRKPVITKAYVCVFVSFTVKAVHLEPVSDLTTEAFLATLRRFIARRGKPSVIWSDHGTNFVGAARELIDVHKFHSQRETKDSITHFCAEQSIEWKFTPEHAPHFGGLWEAAVKSFKRHLRRVVGDVRLTFEELTTTLAQIEACLNSRPLTVMPDSDEGIEVLTPGHFLVGGPLEALPDPPDSFRSIPSLRRWHLCQALTRHIWKRWSAEYLGQLQTRSKWRRTTPNFKVGDIVCVRGEQTSPTRWPLARIIEVTPGKDGLVRVVAIRTSKGVYTRPVTKLVPLLSEEEIGH